MIKLAKTDHPVHDLIARRWSPYGFEDRSVPAEDLRSLFEAARWAASCFNEQPWRSGTQPIPRTWTPPSKNGISRPEPVNRWRNSSFSPNGAVPPIW